MSSSLITSLPFWCLLLLPHCLGYPRPVSNAKFQMPKEHVHDWAKLSHVSETNQTYFNKRNQFLSHETSRVIGSDLVLNDKEKLVDKIILDAKSKEFQQGFQETFPPSINFLIGRPLVEKSTVFDIITKMPKGGILHHHEVALPDPAFIVKNITYLPNLYICHPAYLSLHFKFSNIPPQERNPDCIDDWKLVAEAREEMGVEKFDEMLFSNFTMFTDDPDKAYPNGSQAWVRFSNALSAITDLFFYKETFPALMRASLEALIADNVQYLELRTLLNPMLDASGNVYSSEYTLQQYIKVIQDFQANCPADFVGAKIIYTSIRYPVNEALISQQVKEAVQLRQKYPQYFAGYDLVSQEDSGGPLVDYITALLYPSQNGLDLPFFFHAGETDWQGTFVDNNLIDAVLLNTSRIGHGFALLKHPDVMDAVKERGIAIEINPVSNQVLHLVHDLRDHIGAHLIANNYPVVVSSDDRGTWGALPLSHDYYMAFMGMSGENIGLKLLKQLALNTFKYSAMTETEKERAHRVWQAKWDRFIDKVLDKYGKTLV